VITFLRYNFNVGKDIKYESNKIVGNLRVKENDE
jgi:hypothetical protein